MRLTWVAYGTIKTINGIPRSDFASSRYRVIQPMLALARRGHHVALAQMGANSSADEVLPQLDGDIVVFSKLISPQRGAYEAAVRLRQTLIDALRQRGRTVVADINDDYFGDDFYGPSFRDVVSRVDAVVTSTPEMAAVVGRHTPQPTFVVTDPYEGPAGVAAFDPKGKPRWLGGLGSRRKRLQLVWFGHQSNWPEMQARLPQLATARVKPLAIEIVTAPGLGIEAFCAQFNAVHRRTCELHFTPWSMDATWAALARAAAVLIPSRVDESSKAVKSPNRLVESLRAGRYAIADPLPSYRALAAYCDLTGNFEAALETAIERPAEILDRIAAGQRYIESAYSPEAVAVAWEAALTQTLDGGADGGSALER